MAEEVLSRVEDIIVRSVDLHSSGCVSMLLCHAQAESGWGHWVHPSTVVSLANYIEKRKVYACFWSGLFKVPHKQRYRHPSQNIYTSSQHYTSPPFMRNKYVRYICLERCVPDDAMACS